MFHVEQESNSRTFHVKQLIPSRRRFLASQQHASTRSRNRNRTCPVPFSNAQYILCILGTEPQNHLSCWRERTAGPLKQLRQPPHSPGRDEISLNRSQRQILISRPHHVHSIQAQIASYERSEEHTSELQSRPHLVCRLLLEKKKHAKEPQQADQ